MAPQALVIFDIDGTLLQTELITVPAVQRTFVKHGLPAPEAPLICSFFGKPVEDYERWLAQQCDGGHACAIIQDTNELELSLIGEEGVLYPGVREALEDLKAEGHRLAICSNGPDEYVAEFLRAHGVGRYFELVRTRGFRRVSKQDMVRGILQIVAARPVIVVGDRHDDIAAARANGAYSIAASYGFGTAEELADADAIVHHPGEITARIAELLASANVQ